MSLPSSQQLVNLDAEGRGVVTCPECTKKFRVCGSTYPDLHEPIWNTWSCGHHFPVLFNTRRFYRKDVHLPGSYTPSGGTAKRRMVVGNLSISGIHFHTALPHILQVGDVVELIFHLDDPKHSEIHHKGIIQWVDDKQAGAAFDDVKVFENELNFYLRSA